MSWKLNARPPCSPEERDEGCGCALVAPALVLLAG